MSEARRGFFTRMWRRRPTVAVLRLNGPIGAGGRFGRGLEDAAIAPLVRRAFEMRGLAAVALAINSPGGTPTQSALIHARIRDHAERAETPVFAFCEDVAASGGYMLACAADEIYVDANSIVGSIGVISASFGFDRAIERLGVERRVLTAGTQKLRLDPFQPEKQDDRAWLEGLQKTLHENFIALVKTARGARLGDAPSDDLFSGEVWLGGDAAALGLVDGVGRLEPIMRERFGPDVRFVPVSQRRGLIERLRGATPLGAADATAVAEGAFEALERRALWSRYGL